MPISIKSQLDIEKMQEAGQLVATVHEAMKTAIQPGVSTRELDAIALDILTAAGAHPSFLGYGGFPASICASIDEEIVHGIPSDRILQEGEIISIDVGAYLEGFHGDAAVTYPVGVITEEKQRLIADTESAFWAGFEQCMVGNRVGDISYAIQQFAEPRGYGIIREYGGHGIGRMMHEDPSVLNWGEPGTGARLQPGMTLAVEPMLTLGGEQTIELDDEWTVVTVDGSPAAHYEHTILITADKPIALTALALSLI